MNNQNSMNKNIILQHWTGELNELCKLSSKNISSYAAMIGADYKLLRGNLFRENLSTPCQKVYMLDSAFDDYDIVAMIDPDVFTVRGLKENIFDVQGIGIINSAAIVSVKGLKRQLGHLSKPNSPYWGGSLYVMDKPLRKKLRLHIPSIEKELFKFSLPPRYKWEDEGIMHCLAGLAGLPKTSIPERWSYSSFLPNPEKAAMIHIRTKITPLGPKRTKIENYTDFKNRGII